MPRAQRCTEGDRLADHSPPTANWRQNADGISVREFGSESFGGLNRGDNLPAP